MSHEDSKIDVIKVCKVSCLFNFCNHFGELHGIYGDWDTLLHYLQKRKKATLIASELDNNAPVDQIIEYLEENNKKKNKIYTLYSQTVRQRRTTAGKYRDNKHFLLVGHPLNMFSEDWDGGLNSGYFETFSHKSLLPKMISVIKNIDKKDPVTEYMKKKMVWQDTMQDYKRIMSK